MNESAMSEGVILACQKRFIEAEVAFRQEITLHPDSASAWSNLALLQIALKQEVSAELNCRKALEIDPNFQKGYLNLAYLLLRQGRFDEGWRTLEARNIYLSMEKELPCPRWRGESLEGCSLLIGFEEGYGDMIQFCRYAKVLKERGAAKITLICQPPLKKLLSTMKELDAVYASDESFPCVKFDYWTLPVSLPLYCKSRLDSIPADIPYLSVDRNLFDTWSAELAKDTLPTELRVGLVWKGNPQHDTDQDRSLPGLQVLEPLAAIPGVRFFSLVKGAGEEEAADPLAALPVVNLGHRITDFTDSAAIVANLDLIVSVDTAIVHLAGALGKSCWVLLPDYMTDWRWMTGRSDSPWYPGVLRLFRQREMGEWGPVIEEVVSELRSFQTKPYTTLRL